MFIEPAMQQALIELGYTRVYHTRTVLTERPDDGYMWAELLERKFVKQEPIRKEEWDRLLGDYDVQDSTLLSYPRDSR